MTSPAQRAVRCGAELDRIASFRARRMRFLSTRFWAEMPPSAQSRFLLEVADLDQRIRALRRLVDDQLGAGGMFLALAGAAVPPRPDDWEYEPGGGRHARP